MARRRRTKYTWLPNTGTAGPNADVEDTTSGRDFGTLIANANGTTSINFVDLLDDDPPEVAATVGLPIGVQIGSEYFIKRIVGKVFASAVQTAVDVQRSILVGAGIFIARAEDEDQGGPTFPIGAGTAASAVDNYSPLRQETIREPWIWRRTWILSNQLSTENSSVNIYPRTTAEYGSVADGPHIDAKTARRVGNDERLFMAVAVRNFPVTIPAQTAASAGINVFVDYRVLGAARRAHNRSAF